ncbi:MAG: InlB B-repeat-containing protein, partial [Eubacteriales bacterium]
MAPFRNVESGCTIRNLHVCGDIYTSGKFAAGLVGTQYGTVTISGCRSSVTIHSSTNGDGTHGGLVACVGNTINSKLTIEGCVFDGKLLGSGTTSCGGFVGYRGGNGTVTITNSLFDPKAIEIDNTNCATFMRNGSAGDNCYYTRILGTEQGTAAHTVAAGDEYVTVTAVSPVGNAPANYSASGITAYGNGIVYGNRFYYGSGDNVTLTLSHSDRNGYTFTGYAADAGTLDGATLTMPDGNVTVSASYAANTYTVSFNANGGEGDPMAAQSFIYDEAAKGLTANAYTRTGYDFAGWNTVAAPTEETPGTTYTNGQEVQNLTAEANGTVNLYAQWTQNDYCITIADTSNGTMIATVGETENATTAHYSDTVTLAATPAAGYALGSWDVRDAENNPVTVTNDAFTMPASDVTVSALFLKKAENVPYIDADGSPATQDAYILEGDHSTLPGGWYYVPEGSVSYPAGITFTGDANLILADGGHLTAGSAGDENVYVGVSVWDASTATGKRLTVYGQSGHTGQLTAVGSMIGVQANDIAIYDGVIVANGPTYGLFGASSVNIAGGSVTASGGSAIVAYALSGGSQSTVTITGGTVNATATGDNGNGISGQHSVTITGGTVNATGTGQAYAIGGVGDVSITGGNVTATCENGQGFYSADGNITLGWTNANDSITATSYGVYGNKTLSVQPSQSLKYTDADGAKHFFSGALTAAQREEIAGKTLASAVPYAVNKESMENGDVTPSAALAEEGDTVTLTVTPNAANNYALAENGLSV